MLRKCVSLGNLGGGALPAGQTFFNSEIADLYGPSPGRPLPGDPGAPATTDGYSNISFIEDTQTPWVRLSVSWNFWWPNPPQRFQRPAHPARQSYPSPRPCDRSSNDPVCRPRGKPSPHNLAQFNAQRLDLLANLYFAKYPVDRQGNPQPPRKVILTTIGFPKWLNGTDPSSITEVEFDPANFVLPPDNVLSLPGRKPPGGRKKFLPADFMYSRWVYFLMDTFHPKNNTRSGARVVGKHVWIDAFEFVNEPNIQCAPARDGTPRARSAALMMDTAWRAMRSVNRKYGGGLKLLGPATSDFAKPNAKHPDPRDFIVFTKALLKDLHKLDPSGKVFHDGDFGWSHHNYGDVEHIGLNLRGLQQQLALLGPLLPDADQQTLFAAFSPGLYGKKTQHLRDALRGQWFGWHDPGDPSPAIFLTEGGARLEEFDPNIQNDGGPNTDYTTNPPSDPAAHAKQLQASSVGGAIEALQNRRGAGRGVEMLTNFLFFDDVGGNFSGLLDQYAPSSGHFPRPAPNETFDQYKRPVYDVWKRFRR